MNLEQYAYQDDGRWYVNPQVSLGEQNAFIDNLRNLQAQDNADIQQQTYALGTRVPSNLGGLTGASSYFSSRNQTPKVNSTIAGLRAASQAQALTTALENDMQKTQKIYNELFRKNQLGGGNGSGNGSGDNATEIKGSVKYEDPANVDTEDPNVSDTVVEKNTGRDMIFGNEGDYYVDEKGNRYDFFIGVSPDYPLWMPGVDTFGAGGVGQSYESAERLFRDVIRRGAHVYDKNGNDITDKYKSHFGIS